MEPDVRHAPERADPAPAESRAGARIAGAAASRTSPVDVRPLATLLARIEATYHPEQIWLFGSRARGDASPGSDWDVFVVVPDDTAESDLDPLIAWQLQKGSGIYADVIPCRASEFRDDLGTVNTLSYTVATEGVLLYER